MDTLTRGRLCTRAGLVRMKRARAAMLADEAHTLRLARLAIDCRAVPEGIEARQLAEAMRAASRMPLLTDAQFVESIDRIERANADLPLWVYAAMLAVFLVAWMICEIKMGDSHGNP